MNDKLLIVDDDKELLKIYEKVFRLSNFDVVTASDSLAAVEIVKKENVAVVVSDIIMPKLDGMALLKRIIEINPTIQVIMLTAEGSVGGAVKAVKMGAYTYLLKPAEMEDLMLHVQKAFDLYSIKNENQILKQQALENAGQNQLIGNNRKIQEIRSKISTIGETDATVLITGESGTGKEIAANQLHYCSKRSNQPFIRVNCAALAESLLESELFGHEQGSFTGAFKTHKGKFEAANHGTLLLDEIGELSLGTQAALLRVLQEKEFERVGGSNQIKTDFRLIASTNKNLKEEVARGRFREDLFYRINVVPIYMPPLRERKDDISLLSENWVTYISKEMGKMINPIPSEILHAFQQYEWPGNVRELFNIIERLVVMAKNQELQIADLPEELKENASSNLAFCDTSLADAKRGFEKQFLIQALERNRYNVLKTSEEIQLARKNLYKKIKEYGIKIDSR